MKKQINIPNVSELTLTKKKDGSLILEFEDKYCNLINKGVKKNVRKKA